MGHKCTIDCLVSVGAFVGDDSIPFSCWAYFQQITGNDQIYSTLNQILFPV